MRTNEMKSVVKGFCRDSEIADHHLKEAVSKSYGHYGSNCTLAVPEPRLIRAGKAGGLPFDGLTTDLYLGCLPASQVCYGNCFAAREAFTSGFDFGKRVENILNEEVFQSDLNAIPETQGFLRNGWNSDASWNWQKALGLAELIHGAGKHTVFITKCFTELDEEIAARFSSLGVELRVSISAFDTKQQLERRLRTVLNYREQGGTAIPLAMTTVFKSQDLNSKQNQIVQYMVDNDLPAAENSLRFVPNSSVVELIDEASCGRVAGTGDLWCGRLYADILRVPTLTSLPSYYRGLQSNRLSKNDPDFLNSLWHEPVRTHAEVMSKVPCDKPTQCGVAINWNQVEAKIE